MRTDLPSSDGGEVVRSNLGAGAEIADNSANSEIPTQSVTCDRIINRRA